MMGLAQVTGWGMAGGLAIVVVVLARAGNRRAVRIARCCHELRGPLTAARLGLALEAAGGSRSEAARTAAVEAELRRAALIVDDLSAASSGDGRRGRPRVAPRCPAPLVDLERVAAEVVEARAAVAAALGVELEAWLDGVVIRGDRWGIAQALANLVDNAICHGGGSVRVTTRAGERVVRIEVTDEGPGLPVPVDEIVRRARHRRSRHGHGLVVAAEVAAAHGGRLLTAPAARGARLVLELPRPADGSAVSLR